MAAKSKNSSTATIKTPLGAEKNAKRAFQAVAD